MFTLRVDNDIELVLRSEADSEKFFRLTDTNRAYLRPWLPWVDHTNTVEDTAEYIRECEADFRAGTKIDVGIKYHGDNSERKKCCGAQAPGLHSRRNVASERADVRPLRGRHGLELASIGMGAAPGMRPSDMRVTRLWVPGPLFMGAESNCFVGHRATKYALDHLLGRRDVAAVIAEPLVWQPGWDYRSRSRRC
jgi:hypothetical protein